MSPFKITIAVLGILKVFAKNSINALFALFSIGWAVTLTLINSSSEIISFFEELGTILILIIKPSSTVSLFWESDSILKPTSLSFFTASSYV